LQPQRIGERACAVPPQIKFVFRIQLVPRGKLLFAPLQFGFPFLPPIGVQPTRHEQADETKQPSSTQFHVSHTEFIRRNIMSGKHNV
jgi:hypothetical protein